MPAPQGPPPAAPEFVKFLTNGTVLTPTGFMAGTAACGLRESAGDDLTLLAAQGDCTAAGVFTRNRMAAAPVVVDKETLLAVPEAQRAVAINAGVANAGTGEAGLQAARATQETVADLLACRPDQVLVLSTGVIGEPLNMEKMTSGLRRAAASLSTEGGLAAARAIMTTDTRPKHAALEVALPRAPA
jgi:glutamate N-acetyltransferase/amino-acid N-acetyltransferase